MGYFGDRTSRFEPDRIRLVFLATGGFAFIISEWLSSASYFYIFEPGGYKKNGGMLLLK